ncbi:MAG: endolytic transglycosylase MltG [Oscillibacter sp.]
MAEFKKEDTASWDARQVRDSRKERPAAHHRRRRRRIGLVPYLLFVVVISGILAGIGWLLMNDLCAFNKDDVTVTIEVTAEDTVSTVANKLEDAGLVQYKWFFKLFAGVANADEKIGIGSYELTSDMDYRALIMGMRNSSGSMSAETVRVTIPEGYTVAQTFALLAKINVNSVEKLTEAAQTVNFDYPYIDNTSQDANRLEGYLFPDTYDFYKGEKPSTALNRLIRNFDSKMDETRLAKVKASKYSLEQIVTIASLIEKETDGSDQAAIAAVIYNRLNDTGAGGTYKMLQIDASLLYALPDHTGAITNSDKKTDSPYNLYKYAGLPPTAIANPGLASIDAALNPETSNNYYYALGKDKQHRFFTNYNDHLNFVNSSEYIGN